MNYYANCDKRGRILGVHATDDEIIPCASSVQADTHYFDVKTKTIKPLQAQNLRAVDQRIENIRAPASVNILLDHRPVASQNVVTDTLELQFDLPGDYLVFVDPEDPQWRTEQITLRVV